MSDTYSVGVAKVDITPGYPIRLSGFSFRKTESEGVSQRIWAKALAIDDGVAPAVLLTVDTTEMTSAIVDEVARRLAKAAGLRPDRLALTITHTHTAPVLAGTVPNLFGQAIPNEHQKHIDRYTSELIDKLEKVAREALANGKPARLAWGVGRVAFAVNRRTKGGPVDHDLPVLVVRDPGGKVRAVYLSYACHCVTLSHNKIGGDWAGFAQEMIQDAYPGAVALVSIGCGADSDPSSGVTRDRVDLAARQGAEIAAEVKRLLGGYLAPVQGKLAVTRSRFDLPLDTLPTRAEWQARANRTDAIGYDARAQLARLDRGEPLCTEIPYSIQTWSFGDSLAMVFLAGEVVVDYALRLKRELDSRRLWINAYANDVPAYIPSERVLKEGGYEGRGAMVYYGVPAPFRPGLEQVIIDAIHRQLDPRFATPLDYRRTGGTLPQAPQQSLAAIHTKKDLVVDLVAAEPLIGSPVALDFGPDGRLWVCEMDDYPSGVDGKYKPGGRIRVLESSRGDGIYDKATVFLDGIPFPTGVTVWRRGVLVCAAPDILYAEDTRGTGKADVVRKLYSGFGTDNYQARVNSLEYGLDGWVYGSCGLFGGTISSWQAGGLPPGQGGGLLRLGDRDFRIQPDSGAIEPATGRTQQGRVRDDWGNWFGCDNTNLCWHYPLADHYLRRNPNFAPPPAAVQVPDYPNSNRLFPAARQLQLFLHSGPPGRTTAACGLGVYRDDFLGKQYSGNTFTCEPVNLLVHRLCLTPRGATFSGRRAVDETDSEFLASTDTWFRPVQVRTGPDGALWIVDMYRFVIEHPRWIPAEDLAKVDVRAGSKLGRIYRVRPRGQVPRSSPRLDRLDTAGLVAALDSANGWQRDMATQMLMWRADKAAVAPLEALAANGSRGEARLHALCALDGLGALRPAVVKPALGDAHPGVRRHAVRLAEKMLAASPDLAAALLQRVDDPDAQMQLQLGYTLGEWRDPRAGAALAALALRHAADPYLSAAILSSVRAGNLAEVLAGVFARQGSIAPPEQMVRRLLEVAAALGDARALPRIIRRVATPDQGRFASWQLAALTGLLDSLERRGQTLESLESSVQGPIHGMITHARATAGDDKASEQDRIASVRLLGREKDGRGADLAVLGNLLVPQNSAALQTVALATLGRIADERVPALVTPSWKGYSPALQGQVLDLLLSRQSWLGQLLASIEQGTVPAANVDAARRQRLISNRDAAVRARAGKVFAGAANPDRQKVVLAYQDAAAMAGERVRGKAVFAKSCAVCHLLQGVGHAVGPDLAALSNKSPLYLLQEILDPNKNVDSRYVEYLAVTKAGRTFTGILASETATSIILKSQEGKEQVLLRNELDELHTAGKSLMPEGLEKDLTKQNLADLIAFLASTGSSPKTFPGNRPRIVKPANGAVSLLATTAEIYGGDILFEEPFENIGYWHGLQDHVIWSVQLDVETRFDVYLDWACADASAGNAWILEGTQPALRGTVTATGGWDKYRQEKIGNLTLSPGIHRLTFRPGGDRLHDALLDLRGLHLVPPGETPRQLKRVPPRGQN
jgi:putative membrane-bound dehydrogenase-like protein